jgi:hypothetical protein
MSSPMLLTKFMLSYHAAYIVTSPIIGGFNSVAKSPRLQALKTKSPSLVFVKRKEAHPHFV